MTKQFGMKEQGKALRGPGQQALGANLLELLMPPTIRQHPWDKVQAKPGTVKEGQAAGRQAHSAAPEHEGATRSFAVASSDRSRHGHLVGGALVKTRSRVGECGWTRKRAVDSKLRSNRGAMLNRGTQLLGTEAHASSGSFVAGDGSRKRRRAGGCNAFAQTRRRSSSEEVAFSWRLAEALIC